MNAFKCDEPIVHANLTDKNLSKLTKEEWAFSMARFITEIWKLNREEYPPRMVYQMCVCIQMYLESNKIHWKILNKQDSKFVDFYYILYNVMKQKCAKGLGKVQSAEVISKEAENHMWKVGILGEDHPKQLGETVLFLLGIHLALKGGDKHKQLHHPGFDL